jgi:hypothetical protein
VRVQVIIGVFAILAGVSIAAGQGTGDAIIVKIPAANMPSTVTLSTAGGKGAPGKNVQIPVSMTLTGIAAPGSFQIDLTFDVTQLTFVSASAGAALTHAGEGISSNAVSSGDVRFSTTGTGGNAIASGTVAYATFALSSSFGGATTVTLTNCKSVSTLGSPLSTGCTAGTIGVMNCDVNGGGTVGVADVQAMVNQALGVSPATYDLNQDGVVNATDVQQIINASMGLGCIL